MYRSLLALPISVFFSPFSSRSASGPCPAWPLEPSPRTWGLWPGWRTWLLSCLQVQAVAKLSTSRGTHTGDTDVAGYADCHSQGKTQTSQVLLLLFSWYRQKLASESTHTFIDPPSTSTAPLPSWYTPAPVPDPLPCFMVPCSLASPAWWLLSKDMHSPMCPAGTPQSQVPLDTSTNPGVPACWLVQLGVC